MLFRFLDFTLLSGALIWVNLLGMVANLFAQIDIPKEVWAQYPLILIGVALVGWLARYWVQNEREWRTFVVGQVAEEKRENLELIGMIQAGNQQQLQLIQKNHDQQLQSLKQYQLEQMALVEQKHREQLELQRDGQKEAFDNALERVLDILIGAGHYDRQISDSQPGQDRQAGRGSR